MTELVKAEFLERIDSDVINAVAGYDASKKMYFDLAAIIRNDLPAREDFAGALSAQASEIAYSFGEVMLATYGSYGLEASKETMTNLWFYDQEERFNYMGALVACSSVDCHRDYDPDEIRSNIDDIFIDSDEESLQDNARNVYFEVLESDAQSFLNHIEAIRSQPPSGLLAAILPYELNSRLNTEEMRRKVAKITGFALSISMGGALASKLFKRDKHERN